MLGEKSVLSAHRIKLTERRLDTMRMLRSRRELTIIFRRRGQHWGVELHHARSMNNLNSFQVVAIVILPWHDGKKNASQKNGVTKFYIYFDGFMRYIGFNVTCVA